MTTRARGWLVQIAAVLMLATAGMASGSGVFLGENSCRGQNVEEGVVHRGWASASGEPRRGCADPRLQDAAGLFVAPAAGRVRWAGGVPSEEGLRLVDSARRSLQVPTSRNIAFAESVIEGRSRQLVTGVSGGASPPGTVPSPTNRLFQTRPTRGAIPTNVDSEVKILEEIARDLPRDARGTINLFTERPPCPSCRGVIDQFRERFPNITVNVTNGGK